MENGLITIVGIPNKTFKYTDVKDTVVKIQGQYYRRESPDVVRIKDSSGKLKFFREKSPLIVKDIDGNYMLKEQCLYTEDGVWLNKQSPNVVKIGEKYHRSVFCTNVNGKMYLLTDPDLVKSVIKEEGGSNFILKSESVLLHKGVYGSNKYAPKSSAKIIEYNGEYFLKNDCRKIWSFKEDKPVMLPPSAYDAGNLFTLIYDFQDKTNPQEDRLLSIHANAKDVTSENITKINLVPDEVGNLVVTIPTSLKEYFKHAIDTYIKPRHLSKVEKVREAINKNFSDLDANENIAKAFKHIPRPYPGKHVIFQSSGFGVPVKSKQFTKTGGLKYSFGVEFETSQGLVPNDVCNEYNLLAVGDRSVGAGEYVTSPLMGNDGINLIESICKKALNTRTLVDDRCGIHVHVGTLFKPTEKKPTPSSIEAPSFSQGFLMNSIKLGALIEEELYSSLPQNRKPTLYHCHSIRRFGDINDENFSTYLGAYVFGQKELWYNEDGRPIKPFDFAPYKLGKQYNSNISVGTWAEGRYKWLNLIPSYTRANHRTIEFRIFSATTVFEKVYAYILTSLAFTYIADNVHQIIKPGVTLSQMFQYAFEGHDNIISFLDKFYTERKAKFNRKDLYPSAHPYLKLV